ncbi:MAG TPA: hypothetical protein VFJ24_10415, partial [Gaiellales bacterium]|nr:hypothetical protein [Gaiellales bacterium]
MQRLRDAAVVLRYQGSGVLCWRILVNCLKPLGQLRHLTFCEMDLSQTVRDVRARIDIQIGPATEDDIDDLVAMSAPEDVPVVEHERLRLMAHMLKSFRRGSRCIVARVGKEMVHSNWIHFPQCGPITITPGRYLNLGADEAYMTDGFTPRRWRGYGIHPAVNAYMLAYLQRSGFRRSYTHLRSDNLSSWRGLARVGWPVAGSVLVFTLRGGFTFIWRSSGAIDHWLRTETPPSVSAAPLAPLV